MKNAFFSPRMGFVTVAVIAAALTRFLPHPPNFTAIGAMALFAGACMPNRWMSLLIPAAAMFITDLFLGFHNTLWAVYASFAIITMIGWMVREKQNVWTLAGASLAGAILFFFITNAAMWVVGPFVPAAERFYPLGIEGLPMSITAGIPFFHYTVISQFAYGILFFGAFHAARNWKPSLVKA